MSSMVVRGGAGCMEGLNPYSLIRLNVLASYLLRDIVTFRKCFVMCSDNHKPVLLFRFTGHGSPPHNKKRKG